MILRRLTTAFRKQDWFTVIVEIMIVVLGVFIGLQVNNWNERREAVNREARLIGQLHEAFAAEYENIRLGREYCAQLRAATSAVLETLGRDEPPEDTEAFANNLTISTQSIGPVYEVPILSVMMSTGDLAELSSPILRNALMTYHFQIEGVHTLSASQMQMVSDLSNGGQRGLRLVADEESGFYRIADYDFEELQSARGFYQSQLTVQSQILAHVSDLEATTATIVEELERERR